MGICSSKQERLIAYHLEPLSVCRLQPVEEDENADEESSAIIPEVINEKVIELKCLN
jgi:hypothetical protein